MPELIASLVAQSSLIAGGQVFSDSLRLSVMPGRAILRLQLGARSQKTVNSLKVAGRPLPVAANTWSGDDPVIWRIAPDSWLLSSALHEAAEIMPAVRTGCGRRSYAVTDLSDSLVTIWIEGAQAPALLARGCGLDLSTRAFGNQACTRTRLAQLPVLLRRAQPERLECIVDRAPASWLYEWLLDAAQGL
ncbi:MAG TPA: sarcosine oxidase subunit gamma family protein [Steroidobacteraceae bacterium]|nr:sarcosine oxidase subunit gamma family protein [Steroidobacteraceae bacterium]